MIKRMFKHAKAQREENRLAELYRNLIRHEAKIGGRLFGPVPTNVRREFFCLDKRTWVWHEEWIDKDGNRQIKTTRYDIRPDGVLKAQDGQAYKLVDREELHNLRLAAEQYQKRIKEEIYTSI